jgi:type I restriction enzyme S subunit
MADKAEWQTVLLEEIAASSRNAIVGGPFGSDLVSSDYSKAGVPVIRGENLSLGRWVGGEFVFVPPVKAQQLSANTAGPLDIVFTQRGANHYKQVGVIPGEANGRFVISQSQMKLTVDEKKADPLFVYYLFRAPQQQEYLQRNAIQTGVPHTNLSILRRTPLQIPPLSVQRAIVQVLGALDDKIELNQRMNGTLGSMARAIFKDWFVDFGPTRAKLEGCMPYLAPSIWSLFPDRLDAEGNPEGWKKSTVGEHAHNFDFKRVPVSGAERAKRQGPYPYHGATGIMDHVDDYLFDGIYLLIGEDGSVVNESGFGFAQYVWGKFWVNNHAHVLQGNGSVSTEHLLMYFQHEPVTPYITGAVQLKLSQGRMNSMPFLFAGDAVCEMFSDVVAPLFTQLRVRSDENNTLAQARDALLPKLMSGEIRVKDAEKIAEAAA